MNGYKLNYGVYPFFAILKPTSGMIKVILFIIMLIIATQPSFATSTKKHPTPTVKPREVKSNKQPKKQPKRIKTHQKKKISRPAKKNLKKKSSRKSHLKKPQTKGHPKKTIHTLPRTKVNLEHVKTSHLPSYSLNSKEKNLVNFVQKSVTNMHYTAYKLGGSRIDSTHGIYVIDCSKYVDHILQNTYPQAYTSLTTWSGTDRPTTHDYYDYFTNLSDHARHWNTIEDVEELRPGDILVFRKKNGRGYQTGGHVMVVMDKPIHEGNTFSVRIADSAPSGHTKDTRMPHASGVGIGTILLKVDPKTYQPYAYAWKIGAHWESRVNFAMARPIDLS